jgi:hypothetical protein
VVETCAAPVSMSSQRRPRISPRRTVTRQRW